MGGMSGMGQMGAFGGSNKAAEAEAKKKLKTLTRTDFLLQFVWQPTKPADQPQTKEELDAKLKAEADEADRCREELHGRRRGQVGGSNRSGLAPKVEGD